jgi:Cu(I)-responsive transcriptional regulator
MNIGIAADRAGVSAKMVRHYETIGLLRPAPRRENSYRAYSERDVHELTFIRRARRLGFSIEEIRDLLALWRDQRRPSSEVRRIAQAHVEDLESRLSEMRAMIETLRALIDACPGDASPDCPILTELGD